jgi:hypothetical protein
MIRAGLGRARQAVGLTVPIGAGERARLTVHLVFDHAGTVRDIATVPPPPDRMTRGERLALGLVQRVAAELRRDGRGVHALRQDAEALLELLEHLEEAEAQHGRGARLMLSGISA